MHFPAKEWRHRIRLVSGFRRRYVYHYISLHLSFSESFRYDRDLCWILFFFCFVFVTAGKASPERRKSKNPLDLRRSPLTIRKIYTVYTVLQIRETEIYFIRNVDDSFLSLLTNTQLKLIILVVCSRSCQFHIFSPLLFCRHFLSSDGSLVSVEWSPTILK